MTTTKFALDWFETNEAAAGLRDCTGLSWCARTTLANTPSRLPSHPSAAPTRRASATDEEFVPAKQTVELSAETEKVTAETEDSVPKQTVELVADDSANKDLLKSGLLEEATTRLSRRTEPEVRVARPAAPRCVDDESNGKWREGDLIAMPFSFDGADGARQALRHAKRSACGAPANALRVCLGSRVAAPASPCVA
jgi:hypothetical protein